VVYINTGDFRSYDDLRDELIDKIKEEKPDEAEQDIERLVYGWSEAEVESQAEIKDCKKYRPQAAVIHSGFSVP